MNFSKKEIIFYVLVFLLFYVFAKSSFYFSGWTKINNDLSILIMSLLFTGIIFLLHYFDNKDSKDSFNFELTPEKHCEGGPYMLSSASPEKKKFCAQFSNEEKNYFSCPRGFDGRPVHWERTSMSNDEWRNEMCKDNFNDYNEDPRVL